MTRLFAILGLLILVAVPVGAQDLTKDEIVVRVKPASITIPIGQTKQVEAEVVDIGGRPVKNVPVFFFSRNRRAVSVTGDGKVTARKPGTFKVVARAVVGRQRRGPSATVTVTVPFPEAAAVEFRNAPTRLYVGTSVRIGAVIVDKNGVVRNDLDAKLASDSDQVARIDGFGTVTGTHPGKTVIKASHRSLTAEHTIEVLANPVANIELTPNSTKVRTGDVVKFTAGLRKADGSEVTGVPVHYSLTAKPDDTLGNAATGQIEQDGRFVAESPGYYTVVASSGSAIARTTIRVVKRFKKQRKVEVIGRGSVTDTHTSDLWVWEGVDGRDYCVTGTWGANGVAHFWDVTNPGEIKKISSVTVDARTVNDVKVSKDGKICILSREGASNRKNGIVILDVVDPTNPKILSEFTTDLTGGVHNLFIDGHYVYALSAGRRYDIIDIKDPQSPKRVSSYQIFEPGASIHDVWVEDGIAYSSNWRYGIHMVDVGNGIAGGSPENPKKISSYAYPSGWNHAAFPFKSQETGKRYVVAGDEAFPFGLHTKDTPTYARGWMHFIDFTDLEKPKEVARYQVPEAGTHNLWIEGDLMYAAYYNGGLRVVDISGDLMGDLYKQGREVAWFIPTDKAGKIANAPMVWGPQPHKGHIFFTDWNSGLWAVKLSGDKQ
ncbi:MAG: hypothetical protein CMJ83_16830 [Planctomycetes bacterium]|nr:hypothetical protein [Planctomycetota bacterium]